MTISTIKPLASGVFDDRAKFLRLYKAVNEMMAPLGMYGEISARDDRVQAVMDALYDIDGGVPQQKSEGA